MPPAIEQDRGLQTGYEVISPVTGEISSVFTQIRVIVSLLQRAIQKREIGYAKFAVKLYTHHLLKLLRFL